MLELRASNAARSQLAEMLSEATRISSRFKPQVGMVFVQSAPGEQEGLLITEVPALAWAARTMSCVV